MEEASRGQLRTRLGYWKHRVQHLLDKIRAHRDWLGGVDCSALALECARLRESLGGGGSGISGFGDPSARREKLARQEALMEEASRAQDLARDLRTLSRLTSAAGDSERENNELGSPQHMLLRG